jgi:hypothetical protein
VIVSGGSRRAGAFFATHLTRRDHNERVAVMEIRGVTAPTVRGALREMQTIALGTRTTNYLYHAHMNPREGEQLTPEQWQEAADILERHLGLTGQPRVVVEHEKKGRIHRHVIWNRITENMTSVSDALTYPKHEAAAREIEQRFGHPPVPSVLVKDRKTPRPPRRPSDKESSRGQESGLNPQAIKAELTALWHATGDGAAFAAALAQRGYILARGDRRDFVIVDGAGDDHSLARRLDGIKAAEIRTRLVALDRAALPSVAEARVLARQGSAGGSAVTIEAPIAAAHAAPPVMRHDLAVTRPEASVIPKRPKLQTVRPARMPARDPATAEAQVRQVAAQFIARNRARAPALPLRRVTQLPPRAAARDAAEAAAQVRAIARPFVRALLRSGIIPAMVTAIIDDGLSWWQRAAHYAEALIEDVHAAVMGNSRARG